MKMELENRTIEFHVSYGVRKKISIQIDNTGYMTVKAPNDTNQETIISLVKQHGKQIVEKLRLIEKSKETVGIKEYQEEGKFLHLGKYYFLHELIETTGLTEEELKINLKKFYFSSCKKIIAERIKIYQTQLKVKPKEIEIEESTTKWGSCSSSKKLTFNYRLAMAPIDVIDYVIIHELCHLTHMNHDRSFWRRVGSIMPDYKEKEEFLAKYGLAMTL
ncbi:SprT family zinc-dependent metalloprotease [Paenibacillus chondroitinus]|uniref:SprT family zinc-dependent metalloprotease n=1 Tax=Paenibacillus chondroitinus TaxID=59842 RepID=A0ABU6D8N2_9BACL|nr:MULTISPECIES: SprT family zinc-dependent metalloprotease [Paenibacillus]MCY9659738.1 M48 family metallopeptidase [Paenibacillus anseongense]MEB4794083.1 SprT family zinc-dependent metalloprotease [Paenibacillus chondroitinus]